MPLSSHLLLDASPRSAADARRWVGGICRRLERDDLVECAELGVSELVANAVLHATEPIVVRVRGTTSHPRIEVHDGSTQPPVPPSARSSEDADTLTTFGRGLSIVARSALAWGASIENAGKVVWFEPAGSVREQGDVEWIIDRLLEETVEPTSDSAVEVRLLGMDMELYVGLRLQYAELRRELRLLSLGHQSDYPLAGELTAMFVNLERQFPRSYHDQIRRALERRLPTVDVAFPLVPEAAPIFDRMRTMFDLADSFCENERLLSAARTPEQREFHTWLLGELERQLKGGPATPWNGGPDPTNGPGPEPRPSGPPPSKPRAAEAHPSKPPASGAPPSSTSRAG